MQFPHSYFKDIRVHGMDVPKSDWCYHSSEGDPLLGCWMDCPPCAAREIGLMLPSRPLSMFWLLL